MVSIQVDQACKEAKLVDYFIVLDTHKVDDSLGEHEAAHLPHVSHIPLKPRIRDARGDNFTRSLVMFQVSHPTPNPIPDPHPNRTHGLRGLRHCSACSSLAERVLFCGGSTTTSLGSSCRSCGPKAGPPQAGHTLTSVVSDSFRAASLRSRCTRATPSAALAGPFSCPQRTTAPGG